MLFILMEGTREGRPPMARYSAMAYDEITRQVFEGPLPFSISMRVPSGADAAAEPAPESAHSQLWVPEDGVPERQVEVDMKLDVQKLPEGTTPPSYMLCPISLDLMQDPVVAADGHSYERCYIQRWMLQSEASPKNNERLPATWLVPNHNLRKAILEWFEHQTQPACTPFLDSSVYVDASTDFLTPIDSDACDLHEQYAGTCDIRTSAPSCRRAPAPTPSRVCSSPLCAFAVLDEADRETPPHLRARTGVVRPGRCRVRQAAYSAQS